MHAGLATRSGNPRRPRPLTAVIGHRSSVIGHREILSTARPALSQAPGLYVRRVDLFVVPPSAVLFDADAGNGPNRIFDLIERRPVLRHGGEVVVTTVELDELSRCSSLMSSSTARNHERAHPEPQRELAPLIIGVGPNFVAGKTIHVAIESQWGPNLGAIVEHGQPQPRTAPLGTSTIIGAERTAEPDPVVTAGYRGQVVSEGRKSGRGRRNVVTCRHRPCSNAVSAATSAMRSGWTRTTTTSCYPSSRRGRHR